MRIDFPNGPKAFTVGNNALRGETRKKLGGHRSQPQTHFSQNRGFFVSNQALQAGAKEQHRVIRHGTMDARAFMSPRWHMRSTFGDKDQSCESDANSVCSKATLSSDIFVLHQNIN